MGLEKIQRELHKYFVLLFSCMSLDPCDKFLYIVEERKPYSSMVFVNFQVFRNNQVHFLYMSRRSVKFILFYFLQIPEPTENWNSRLMRLFEYTYLLCVAAKMFILRHLFFMYSINYFTLKVCIIFFLTEIPFVSLQ